MKKIAIVGAGFFGVGAALILARNLKSIFTRKRRLYLKEHHPLIN